MLHQNGAKCANWSQYESVYMKVYYEVSAVSLCSSRNSCLGAVSEGPPLLAHAPEGPSSQTDLPSSDLPQNGSVMASVRWTLCDNVFHLSTQF